MKSRFLKVCSLLLVLALLVNMLPMSIFAQDFQESIESGEDVTETTQTVTAEDAYVVDEIKENRTEYSKEFLLSNGLHMATLYPDAVHYEKDGAWAEIDNTLVADQEGFLTNTAGIWEVRFPQQLSKEQSITVEKDGYTLSFFMAGELTTPVETPVTPTLPLDKLMLSLETALSDIFAVDRPEVEETELTVDGKVEKFGLLQMQQSAASVQPVDTESLRQAAEHPETVPEKNRSRLRYGDVYQNTHILYDLDSNKVKESVVMDTYNSNLRGYRYTLDVGTMVPVLEDDGQITFYDPSGETVIMVMPAPYLVDDAGVENSDILVQLTGSGSSYTMTYLLPQQWLAAEDRAWPVVLDPVITPEIITSNIRDKTVAENNDFTDSDMQGMLHVGRTNYGIARSYLMYYDLPKMSPSDVIVSASIRMKKPANSSTTTTVEVHQVTSDWPETLLWNNKPSFNTSIEDYAIVYEPNTYYWTVTDIVRDWYTNKNTGMMFKASDSTENATSLSFKQFCSSDYSDYYDTKPTLFIYFRNTNGLESYWGYTSSTAGNAGTSYINNYTGNLVWVHEDMGFSGNRMPVSISHIYNMNDNGCNDFGLGNGWRTNYNQRVYQWDKNPEYYIWEDSDGTKHYFLYDAASSAYKDEDGLEMTLKIETTDYGCYTLTDKDGNKSYFDSKGRLVRIQNNQKTVSSIDLTYMDSTSCRISTITDGVGRLYQFLYTEAGLAYRLKYSGTGATEIKNVTFGYDGTRLTQITKPGGMTSTFVYDSTYYLMQVVDADGYKLTYDYNTTSQTYQPYRIIGINEYSGTTLGGTLDFEYSHNETKITDHNGNVEILQFNDFGNVTCIQDGEGRAQYAQFAKNTDEDTGKGNQLKVSSKLQNTVSNLLNESSFESGNPWTARSNTSMARSAEAAYLGSYALKMTGSGADAGVYSPVFTVDPDRTVTFSAYVKAGSAYQLMLQRKNPTVGYTDLFSEVFPASNGWVRQQVSYTNNTGSTLNMWAFLVSAAAGTFYMDCVQVEIMPTASRYNLIENGDFRNGSSGWDDSSLPTGGTVLQDPRIAAPNLTDHFFSITGSPTVEKHLTQTVPISGSAGDSFVFSGWAWADNAVPEINTADEDNPREFNITLTANYTDGTIGTATAKFNPGCNTWQYTAGAFAATKAYNSIELAIHYDHNANTVWFDGFQLYKEEFGTSYTYDDDGNVISVTDLQKKNTTYEYDANNNLTRIVESNGAEMTYEYDAYHNVTKATSKEGVVYTFDYDQYGNNTAVSIVNGDEEISTWAYYSSNGNQLIYILDPLNRRTIYNYDEQTGELNWVQYPEDLAQENSDAYWTDYVYDAMGRVTKVIAFTEDVDPFVDYTYELDKLSTIHTAGGTFRFTYGNFGLRTKVSVDGHGDLANYTYTNGQNNYLESLDYGNGDSVDYSYDNKGRLTQEIFEDGDTVTYAYDNNGALATVTDSQSGRTTRYYYDLIDRMMQYTETGDNYFHSVGYGYDTDNNLTQQVEDINGQKYTTSHTYDEDNRVTSSSDDAATKRYTYDNYGRVTQEETKYNDRVNIKVDNYTYQDHSTDYYTSSQVASHEIYVRFLYWGKYSYEYDQNGNITKITKTDNNNTSVVAQYDYDTLNRLIREDSAEEQVTRTWYYDRNGNIANRKEYGYKPDTATANLGSPVRIYTYNYNTSGWEDMLVSYTKMENGRTETIKTYKYDQIGNPTYSTSCAYTWEHGRLLMSMGNPGQMWNFAYDANGMRTQRTDGTDTYTYVYNGSQLTQMTKGSNTLHFSYDAKGTPLGVTLNGAPYYYVTNLQGDVIGILDSNYNLVATYTYDAWGNPLSATGTSAIATLNPLRYRGYVYDSETKLYYVGSRYYDPEVGRFISPDTTDVLTATPMGLTDKNLFAYCDNNPVMREDSGGYFWDTAFDVVSLCFSVADVIKNPDDPMAWLGVAADVASLVIPCVSGGGALVRAATKTDDVVDAVKAVSNLDEVADAGKAIRKSTKSARSSAVRKAWKNEVALVESTGKGTRNWTTNEIDELLNTGKVKGYVGHHMKSVKGYPELAGDPLNIQFLTRKEHLLAHGGNWRNITHGRYIP